MSKARRGNKEAKKPKTAPKPTVPPALAAMPVAEGQRPERFKRK